MDVVQVLIGYTNCCAFYKVDKESVSLIVDTTNGSLTEKPLAFLCFCAFPAHREFMFALPS